MVIFWLGVCLINRVNRSIMDQACVQEAKGHQFFPAEENIAKRRLESYYPNHSPYDRCQWHGGYSVAALGRWSGETARAIDAQRAHPGRHTGRHGGRGHRGPGTARHERRAGPPRGASDQYGTRGRHALAEKNVVLSVLVNMGTPSAGGYTYFYFGLRVNGQRRPLPIYNTLVTRVSQSGSTCPFGKIKPKKVVEGG